MTDTTAAGPSVTTWRNAVIGLFATGGVAISTWGPRLPSIRADLGIGDGTLGLVLAAVTVGSFSGLLLASPVLGRLGARRTLTVCLVLMAAAIAVVGLGSGVLHSVVPVLIAFLFAGLGLGTLDVSVNVEGAAVEQAARRTLMPLMHAGWSAGVVAGSGIGAACAALGIAPVQQFSVEAVLVAAVGVVLPRFLHEVEPEAADPLPIRTRLRRWASGWADLRLLLIGVVILGAEVGELSANNWLTLAARDGHGLTDAIAALYFTVFAAGETLTRVVAGPLVDRIGRANAVRATTAIGVVGLILFIVGGPPWVVLIGAVFWSVGVSMGFPLGMSAAAEGDGDSASRVSVVASIGYLAGFTAPPVIGFLSQSAGLLPALWVVAALLAVAFVAAGAVRRRSGEVSAGSAG